MSKIILASDHAGFDLKEKLKVFLTELGYQVEDIGPAIFNENDDYPDFIIPAAKKVVELDCLGIILGGSGQGEAMAANKVKGVRAVIFYGPMLPKKAVDVTGRQSEDPFELIKLAKEHNHANVLSLGVRFLDEETMKKAVKLWLETQFSNEERHVRRLKKVDEFTQH